MSQGERTLSIRADLGELETLRLFFEAYAAECGMERDPTLDLLVALGEVVTNVIVHGYKGEPGIINLHLRPSGHDLELVVRDRARLFDPTTVPPPRTDLPLELRPPGGMGVLLTRHYTDELRYRVTPELGNELTLVKRGVLAAAPKENDRGADS